MHQRHDLLLESNCVAVRSYYILYNEWNWSIGLLLLLEIVVYLGMETLSDLGWN